MHQIRLAAALTLVVGGLLAGCGSASKSSTSTTTPSAATTSSTPAVAPHATAIRGVPSRPGAIKPSPAALKKLVHVAKGGIAPHIQGLSNLPLDQQLTALDNDINGFWSKIFSNSNIKWPPTQQILVTSTPVQTQCTSKPMIAPTDPWFLCDPTFYWTLPWMQQNISPRGNVALAFDVGVFWTFHVQYVLGFTQAMEKGQMTKGQWGNQALCLTGNWVRTLGNRNLFEQGDTQALQSVLNDLQGIGGVGPPDVTQQSLAAAFVSGYNSGSPSQCTGGGGGGGGGGQTTPTTTTPTPTPTPTPNPGL
jgi:hypothetical protein